MNSPYTKHLDATLDAHHTHSTALTVPTYAAAPVHATPPMIIQSGGGDTSGGGKASIALIAIVLAVIAGAAGFAFGKGAGPSWNELRRFEALSGREGEIRGRDAGWNQGRKQGRTEMEFAAKYERLRTQAGAFNQGYMQGKGIGQQMGRDRYMYNSRYNGYGGYGGRGYGRGYGYGGYGYGGRVGNAISSAQSIANATGSPVDVIID